MNYPLKLIATGVLSALTYTSVHANEVNATQTAANKTAIILPGLYQDGADRNGSPLTAEQVKEWELTNSALVFGSFPTLADNLRATTVGYMYNQKLEVNGEWLEHRLREYAKRNNHNYEDYFLHFAEDTILGEVNTTHADKTVLNRRPQIVGYAADTNHAGFWLYQPPPWNTDVFEHVGNGGALYVYSSEPYDQLEFTFSQLAQGGSISIEYPTATDDFGRASQWSSVRNLKDKSRSFSQNGTLQWRMPANWVRATTHDGSGASYGGGQYFGNPYLRDGGQLYVVRIAWQAKLPEDVRPRLANVQLAEHFPVVPTPADAPVVNAESRTIQRWRKIRGFDASSDANEDGYLNKKEYRRRNNLNATARFRWESRVIPFGSMWSPSSSFALTNLASPQYLSAISDYYQAEWAKLGLNGAYNDDTNRLMGKNQFTIYSGGTVAELNLKAGSNDGDALYKQQFSDFLTALNTNQSDALIGLNVGPVNLYGRNGQNEIVNSGSLYLREHYIFPTTGLSGYAGINKFWDNAVLAAAGKKTILQSTTRFGRVQFFGNTQANWEADQYSSLAIFYLNYQTDSTYFNQWNSGFVYGSDNTTSYNYYDGNIPKNIAYQPINLLAFDLGTPTNIIPAGHEPMSLMLSTRNPLSDYTVVGDSTSTSIVHADLPSGIVDILPTHTYFAYKAGQVVPGAPADMVLAREFSNGKVLYRTSFDGKDPDFFYAVPVVIELEQPMRVMDQTGEFGEYVDQVVLKGYDGLILSY